MQEKVTKKPSVATVGIICEYNPFHGGHAYQIETAKTQGAECVVCLMSGSFTERGEPAIADKYARAEMAIRGGADLVLELPYPFSAAGAEYFARAGVRALDAVGVERLVFGSENGELDFLQRASAISRTPDFRAQVEAGTKKEKGSAAAYFDCLGEALGVSSFGSNDVLGIAYLNALHEERSAIEPLVIRRAGAGYREKELSESGFPSATAIRHRLGRGEEGALDALSPVLPAATEEVLRREIAAGLAPASFVSADRLIPAFFRLGRVEDFSEIAELSGGLLERMLAVSAESTTNADFFARMATKKYTDSRIRRGVLFALTGVQAADLRRRPAYLNLLGASQSGCGYLAARKKGSGGAGIPIVTRPAEILQLKKRGGDLLRQAELQAISESLYTMLLPSPRPAGEYLTRRPYLEG